MTKEAQVMPSSNDYQRFRRFAETFSQSRPNTKVSGDYYDLPGVTVYHSATQKLPDGGRIEVNRITPEAPPTFAWETEITINDKPTGRFVHLILQRDHSVTETYGKTILPVDSDRAAEIFTLLAEFGAV